MPDPFRWFTGREDVLKSFDEMLEATGSDWHCVGLVGLSGTGKSFVIDYLCHRRHPELASCTIQLRPEFDPRHFLQQLCADIGGLDAEDAFVAEVRKLERPLYVHVAPQMMAHLEDQAVADTIHQQAHLCFNLPGTSIPTISASSLLDLLVDVLAPVRDRTWLLCLDDVEHLAAPASMRFVMRELLPRLRRRFPGFRLLLSGQKLPTDGLREHEVRRISLEPFSAEHSREMLERIGVSDAAVVARVHEQTGGLPYRLNSYGVLEADPNTDLADLERLDGDCWVQRVHDKIVGTLHDEALRRIACYLPLLDFFDEGILSAVFDIIVTWEGFSELVERGFAKRIVRNRWRCHDIIRHDLGRRQQERNPERCREINRRAFNIYRERIEAEVEKHDRLRFEGRLELAIAALKAIATVSAREADEFLRDELVFPVMMGDGDYVTALHRAADDARVLSNSSGELLLGLERGLERSVVGCPVRADVESLVVLAQHACERELDWDWVAGYLFARCAWICASCGARDEALTFAVSARDRFPDNEPLWLDLAEHQATFGLTEDSRRTLEEAAARFGRTAESRLAEAVMVFAEEDGAHRGRRMLIAALEEFPDSSALRMRLAEELSDHGEATSALEQTARVLVAEPKHERALQLRAQLLFELGRWENLTEALMKLPSFISDGIDEGARMLAMLSEPRVRFATLTQFREAPQEVRPNLLNHLGAALAQAGDVDTVRELAPAVGEFHPILHSSWQVNEALALSEAGRPREAVPILQALLESAPEQFGAWLMLAHIHASLGELESAREVMLAWRDFNPHARDLATARLASFETSVEDGLRVLEVESSLGPHGRLAKALLLSHKPDAKAAIHELESLLRSDIMFEAPRQLGIQARDLLIDLFLQESRLEAAAEAATKLLELYPSERAALDIAAETFSVLGDVEMTDRATRHLQRGTAKAQIQRIALLTRAVEATRPTVDELLRQVEVNPRRLELVQACENLLLKSGQTARLEALGELAAESWFELRELSLRALAEMPQLERNTVRRGWRDLVRNGIKAAIAALRVLAVSGWIDEARELVEEACRLTPEWREPLECEELACLVRWAEPDVLRARIEEFRPHGQGVPPSLAPLISEAVDRCLERTDAIEFHRGLSKHVPPVRVHELSKVVNLLIADKRVPEALQLLDELGPQPSLLRATALAESGQREQALAVIDACIEAPLKGLALASALDARGDCLRALNRIDQAIAAYEGALAARPHYPLAKLGLFRCYEAQERWRDAYNALLDVLAEWPEARADYEADLRRVGAQIRLNQPGDRTCTNSPKQ
ncbi:MAG: tetratricopeptide repeat protein [Enhygromyxa sp.]